MTVARSVVRVGYAGSVSVAGMCVFAGAQSWRTRADTMQHISAYLLFAAAVVTLAAQCAPVLRRPSMAAIRLAFVCSVFVWRGLALIVVGSNKIDRTSELLAAGTSMSFAVVVLVMRLLYESATAGFHARD